MSQTMVVTSTETDQGVVIVHTGPVDSDGWNLITLFHLLGTLQDLGQEVIPEVGADGLAGFDLDEPDWGIEVGPLASQEGDPVSIEALGDLSLNLLPPHEAPPVFLPLHLGLYLSDQLPS